MSGVNEVKAELAEITDEVSLLPESDTAELSAKQRPRQVI